MRRAGLPRPRAALAFALAMAAALAVAACSGPAAARSSHAAPRVRVVTSYYLALGDSLSQGVQPDAIGASVETGQGYPDLVYAALRRGRPGLRLVALGCPGETTGTFIDGGICGYPHGVSQLGAAVAFLGAHRGHVLLITIDIGANDPEDCGLADLAKAASCLGSSIPAAVDNLTTIMTRLRAAAGPAVRIVGMNYYLPELAAWRDGPPGQAAAWMAERLAAGYNDLLDRVYTASGAHVANVFGAFQTADFGGESDVPGLGTVPRNVALLCRWTWECAAPPRGPNQHANRAGYQVIAGSVLQASGLG
jgi:lysophospholipase L1-like esterase